MANDILTNYRGKVVAVVKATRAGATFSLLKRACELKQKTVIVAPYIKIFDKTVNEVAESFGDGNKPKVARIAKNEAQDRDGNLQFPRHDLPPRVVLDFKQV